MSLTFDGDDGDGEVFVNEKNYAQHSILDLRERFRPETVSDLGTIEQIIRDFYCNIRLWGVLTNKVLVWNGQGRLLITVIAEGVARVECFLDQGSEEDLFCVEFYTDTASLTSLRKELLYNRYLNTGYENIFYGTHIKDFAGKGDG